MFTEQEKAVYEYHDGEKLVAADPFVLQRAVKLASIKLAGMTIYKLSEQTRPPGEQPDGTVDLALLAASEVADAKLAEVVRSAFGLRPFDPETRSGVTERMVSKIWADWCGWLRKND